MEEKVKVKAVPCEVYSRVVGYFRPVANWNPGKQVEFAERKTVRFEVPARLRCGCGA
ncbi:MAG: anaerobic ribonucleoside-triphosphate reductase [Caldimicrobium sp.]|nr:anaerobic ribonucleoside-triphosphate reductase [Caldimicrobium sp.]MCX7613465.1 anaerobic ribonucleoside-triphosphate reductase [Caldimicrobium sp.]MDW8182963.1 anaerobic ribonucleoside-triphosphate reductase [Caldimicrobium sp.]